MRLWTELRSLAIAEEATGVGEVSRAATGEGVEGIEGMATAVEVIAGEIDAQGIESSGLYMRSGGPSGKS